MLHQEKITFKKENLIKKLLTFNIGKIWLLVLLIIGILVLFSAGEDNMFSAIVGMGMVGISIMAIIFL